MRLAILGTGAVGIGLANALARAGERLHLIGRDPETRRAIEAHGLLRTGLFGSRHVPPEQLAVATSLASVAANPPDWLLVCTKAFATPAVAESLARFAPAWRDRTRLLLCQNGWGNEAPFLSDWPEEGIFHARVITGFHRRRLHEVEITAHAAPIALGSVFQSPHGSLRDVARRIDEGGLPTETREDMRETLWAKMLYNCALNPLGALVGQRYGALTENPATRSIVEAVIREIFDVLRAARIELPWTDADSYLETFHGALIPPTAEHESSMLQDLRAGRPTEIEALCGAVERLAEAQDVGTPVVSALALLVRRAQAHRA